MSTRPRTPAPGTPAPGKLPITELAALVACGVIAYRVLRKG